MSRLGPADQVLKATADLLAQHPDRRSVDTAWVLRALGWPEERREEVLRLLVELWEEGYLRLPRDGPFRGDGGIMDIDVLGITPKGRVRLAELSRPPLRRASRWTAGRVRVAVGAFILAVLAALGKLAADAVGHQIRLP